MRARNIKPGFFKNEQLAELPAEARLLYIGLWMMADREGRLEDRPRRMKMEIFPADSYECEPLLLGLEREGLIIRYTVDGGRYIEIPRFKDHQSPHHTEKDSVIPPPDSGKEAAFKSDDSGNNGGGSATIPGALQEHNENNGPGTGGHSGHSRNRSPLNPDSLNPESRILNPEKNAPTKRGSRATPTTIPDDWELNEANREWLASSGLSLDEQAQVVQEFVLWAQNSEHRKVNWDVAFSRNPMVKSAVGRGKSRKNGGGPGYKPSRSADELEAEALARGEDPWSVGDE